MRCFIISWIKYPTRNSPNNNYRNFIKIDTLYLMYLSLYILYIPVQYHVIVLVSV